MPFPIAPPVATAATRLLLVFLLILLHPIAFCRAKPHPGFGHMGRTHTRPNHHPHHIPPTKQPTPPLPNRPAILPPPPATPWRHHVFLSFRGPDVRHTFSDHLYYALLRRGIEAFRDDHNLPRGENVTEAIPRAIEESKLSIVVLSRGYASSEYCLDELVKILLTMKEKGHQPFPVFYKVSPDDVADHQSSGCYKDDFDRHKRRYSYERVEGWSHALTSIAEIAGWVLTNFRSEAEMVENIAEDMLLKSQEQGGRSRRQSIRTRKQQLMDLFICDDSPRNSDGTVRICGTKNVGESSSRDTISLENVLVYDHLQTTTSEGEPVVTRQPAHASGSTNPSSVTVPTMAAGGGTWRPPSDTDTDQHHRENEVGSVSSSCNRNKEEETIITVDHHHQSPAASATSDEEAAGDQEDVDVEQRRRLWASRTCSSTSTCNNNNDHNHQHHPHHQHHHKDEHQLKFIKPEISPQGKKTVRIPKTVAQEEIKRSQDLSLIAQQLSNTLPPQINTTTILNEAYKLWNISSSSAWIVVEQVGTASNGLYIITFSSHDTRDRVVESSPWCIASATFVMRKWQPNLQLTNLVQERSSAIPVWVRLVGVPVEYMNAEGLSHIASALGKPLYMDRATTKRSQLAFAKVCVEMMRLNYNEGSTPIVVYVTLGGDDDDDVVKLVVRALHQWRPCHGGGA